MSQKAPNTPQLDGQESNLHLLVALRKLRRANVRLQRAADDAKKREYKWRGSCTCLISARRRGAWASCHDTFFLRLSAMAVDKC